MKCLKNILTGNIIRVDDKQAHQMSGSTWKYVSKDEWKNKKIVQEVSSKTDEMPKPKEKTKKTLKKV